MTVTEGTLLNGRVRYRQSEAGYRTGIEPVLLAASVPAHAGERVFEAGTGAGAGLLCLAARVAGITGLGLERNGELACLARDNFAANGFDGLMAEQGDVLADRRAGGFDHAFANPPWHDPAGTPSPEPKRRAAKHAESGTLAKWAVAMARLLRTKGTLSLILPAAHLSEGVAALCDANCPEIRLLPLWPRHGSPAKLIIMRAIHHGRGSCTVDAGMTLHDADGGFTDAAQAVLRGGARVAF